MTEQQTARTAYENAVDAARQAGRCEQCVAYGVRPGLFCIFCGYGDGQPFAPSDDPTKPRATDA
jgi:hypothetical protein